MANKHGDFIWYEYMANDAEAIQNFYGEVLGWTFVVSGQSEEENAVESAVDYRIILAQDAESGHDIPVGGLLQISDEMEAGGARPVWLGYIAVDDVDASVTAIGEAGGSVLMAASDIPQVGRIAMVTDPQGVPFYIMRGIRDEPSLAFAFDRPRVGHCAWNELSTTDTVSALMFYSEQFDWSKDGEMPMGDMGAYEFLRHTGVFGAMMAKPANLPVPVWTFYFRVSDIDVAVEKVISGGGQVLLNPQEIPGGEYVIQGIDPQGAAFALVGQRQ